MTAVAPPSEQRPRPRGVVERRRRRPSSRAYGNAASRDEHREAREARRQHDRLDAHVARQRGEPGPLEREHADDARRCANVPAWTSRMIASRRSRSWPPNRPSAASARPSRCSAPVIADQRDDERRRRPRLGERARAPGGRRRASIEPDEQPDGGEPRLRAGDVGIVVARRRARNAQPGEELQRRRGTPRSRLRPRLARRTRDTPADSNVAISRGMRSAASSSVSASAAPVPSPSRMSRSSSGRRPRCSSAMRCPGSADMCEASM